MEKNLLLTKAKNAEMAHDFATAAHSYNQLLENDSTNVDYLKAIASVYVQAGEDEKAIPYYEKLISYYPHYIEAMNSLGAIYRRLKKYPESINILRRALSEGRQIPSVNYNLGFTYKEMGEFSKAIESFESVIEVKPNDVLAHNHLGSIYFTLKDYSKAIAAFKRGLLIDHNHPILNYNLARCYERTKKIPDAIRCYALALKTRPGWKDAVDDFSSLLLQCKQNADAQKVVEQSIDLHPDDVELVNRLGQVYLNEFDYENAEKTYKKASKMDDAGIESLIGLAKTYERDGRTEESINTIKKVLETSPEDKDARKQYSRSLLTAEQYDEAHNVVDKLYKEDGGDKDLEVLDIYGQYYLCLDDEEKAQGYYDQIQVVNHHYKDHLISAAERSMQIGKLDRAEEYVNKYIERRPQNPDGYLTMGKICEQKGDLVSAKNYYQKTVETNKPNAFASKKFDKLTQVIGEMNKPVDSQNIEEGPVAQQDGEKLPENELVQNEEGFDFDQMGGSESIDDSEESTELDEENYFDKLADNLEKDYEDEESDSADVPTYDNDMGLIDEDDSSFNFDQEDDENNPLTMDDGKQFFGDDAGDVEPASEGTQEVQQEQENPQDNMQQFASQQMPQQPYTPQQMAPQQFAPQQIPPQYAPQQPYYQQPMNAQYAPQGGIPQQQYSQQPSYQQPQSAYQNEAAGAGGEMSAGQMGPLHKKVQDSVNAAKKAFDDIQKIVDQYDSQNPDFTEASDNNISDSDNISAESESVPSETEDVPVESDENAITSEDVPAESEDVMESSEESFAESEDDTPADSTFEVSPEDSIDETEAEKSLNESNTENSVVEEKSESKELSPIQKMVSKIKNLLDNATIDDYGEEELKLFKSFRELCKLLPEEDQNSYHTCKARLQIEYIISKLSGKEGLLFTANNLLKSGDLGPESEIQLSKECDIEMGNDLIIKVLNDMKNLSCSLDDQSLIKACDITIDSVLERLELL